MERERKKFIGEKKLSSSSSSAKDGQQQQEFVVTPVVRQSKRQRTETKPPPPSSSSSLGKDICYEQALVLLHDPWIPSKWHSDYPIRDYVVLLVWLCGVWQVKLYFFIFYFYIYIHHEFNLVLVSWLMYSWLLTSGGWWEKEREERQRGGRKGRGRGRLLPNRREGGRQCPRLCRVSSLSRESAGCV